jgi:hypothetical protein
MATIIFIDESIITDIENRPRVDTDIVPRSNDWVVIPGEKQRRIAVGDT